MPSLTTPVVFVPSTDLARSRRFYEGVLGLSVVHDDGFAVVVDLGAAVARVTYVGATFHVQPFTVLGWQVEDIEADLADLVARGVELLRPEGIELDASGVWTAPDGTRVAWFHDPDGNTLSLDRPR